MFFSGRVILYISPGQRSYGESCSLYLCNTRVFSILWISLTNEILSDNLVLTTRTKGIPNCKIPHLKFIPEQDILDASIYFTNKVGQFPQSIRKDGRQIIKFTLRKLILLAKVQLSMFSIKLLVHVFLCV